MGTSLMVAAGGGGDAIAAAMIVPTDTTELPCIATFAWDRLIIDPVPGPRSISDFVNLVTHGPNVHEITNSTELRPPARSSIPRLATELPARFFLLDPTDGAQGMAAQLQAVARHAGADTMILVDVGGDLVARGDEPDLRSPLADTLALVACQLSGLPFVAYVCGPGLDGELSEPHVLERCRDLSARQLPDLTRSQADRFQPTFEWHPTEATGLFGAAARGRRGTVEVRDAGSHVRLTEHSAAVFELDGSRVIAASLLAGPIAHARTLSAVEQAVRDLRGETELDYERTKAAARRNANAEEPASVNLADLVDEVTEQTRARGADYITVRRLAELLPIRGDILAKATVVLRTHNADRYDPPLWRVS